MPCNHSEVLCTRRPAPTLSQVFLLFQRVLAAVVITLAVPEGSGFPTAQALSDARALGEWSETSGPRIRPSHFAEDTCAAIAEEANKQGMPQSFFEPQGERAWW
jgi:hypothetical protein